MLSRISEYIWGQPPVAEPSFKPHPGWLIANQAHGRNAVVKPVTPPPIPLNPLISAIKQGHHERVRLLIAAGADVNAYDGTTYTPLIWAAGYRQREMVGMLLQAGADPHFVAADGCSAEGIAAHHHDFDIVELLYMDIFTLRAMDFSLQPLQPEIALPKPNGAVQQALDEADQDEEYDQFFEDLIDPVTYKPIKNPIVLPSGHTLDQETVLQLVERAKGGAVLNPFTREPLTEADLRAKPNRIIKKVIEDRERAWANRLQFFGANVPNKTSKEEQSTAVVLLR